jgi:acyl-CoA synthetase (AMP-forming)/AMP-acid ligase II
MLSFIAERSVEDADALVRPDGLRLTYASLAMATAAVQQAIDARVGDVRGLLVGIAVDDAAGFVATLLAVLEAGGVALPLFGASAQADAENARAVAVVVGDPAEDRLDVVAGDATRRQLPAEAALALAAGAGRRAVIAAPALGATVDAVVAAELRTAATRTPVAAPFGEPAMLMELLATLRAGGTIVDARAPAAPAATVRGLDAAECLRVGHAGVDRVVHPLAAGALAVVDGELEVRGPGLMMGYLDDDVSSHAAWSMRNGERWLRLGRALERGISGGSGAHQAAIIAVPVAGGGARVYGFVDDDELPLPAAIKRVVLESLPHTPDGAIDRRALLRMVSAD